MSGGEVQNSQISNKTQTKEESETDTQEGVKKVLDSNELDSHQCTYNQEVQLIRWSTPEQISNGNSDEKLKTIRALDDPKYNAHLVLYEETEKLIDKLKNESDTDESEDNEGLDVIELSTILKEPIIKSYYTFDLRVKMVLEELTKLSFWVRTDYLCCNKDISDYFCSWRQTFVDDKQIEPFALLITTKLDNSISQFNAVHQLDPFANNSFYFGLLDSNDPHYNLSSYTRRPIDAQYICRLEWSTGYPNLMAFIVNKVASELDLGLYWNGIELILYTTEDSNINYMEILDRERVKNITNESLNNLSNMVKNILRGSSPAA